MIDFACKRFELNGIIKCGLGLTKSDFRVMKYLLENRKQFNSFDIAKSLELDSSTVQRTLKKLSEKNIVIRSQINLANGGYQFRYEINDKREIRKIILSIVHAWTKRVEEELEKW